MRVGPLIALFSTFLALSNMQPVARDLSVEDAVSFSALLRKSRFFACLRVFDNKKNRFAMPFTLRN